MKKLALLILLAVFATASATACSKDDKKTTDKTADDKVAADKAAADKLAADKAAAKGVDSDMKKEEAPAVTDRKLSDEDEDMDVGGDDIDGDDMDDDDDVMPDPDEKADGTKKPAASGDASFDAAFVKTAMTAYEGLVKLMEKNKDNCPAMATDLQAFLTKNAHIKDKVDAIEDDPAQKKKWDEATKATGTELMGRMMEAVKPCMEDPAVLKVLETM